MAITVRKINLVLASVAVLLLLHLGWTAWLTSRDRFHIRWGTLPYSGPTLLAKKEVEVDSTLYFNEEEGELLKTLLGKLDREHPERDPFVVKSSCAVVGNSSKLLGSGLGPRIDSFGTVLRINEAPTKGYESDVGNRTDVRYVNSHRMPPPDAARDQVALILSYYMNDNLRQFIDQADAHWYEGFSAVRVLSPQISWWADSVISHYPSSGLTATLLSIKSCDRVGVFGMGPGKDGLWSHYFPKETPNPPHHSHEAESELFELLQRGGLIEIF